MSYGDDQSSIAEWGRAIKHPASAGILFAVVSAIWLRQYRAIEDT